MDRLATRHRLFLVVFAHCCDPFVARFDTDRPTFLQGCALGSAVRCCVPLFVMMTGVLLFPVRNGMSEFYKKADRPHCCPAYLPGRSCCLYCISFI